MHQPQEHQPNHLTAIGFVAYANAFGVVLALIRWSWIRFDWLALLIAIASPFIGLVFGGLSMIVFAWLVFAVGYVFSAEFRREMKAARAEIRDLSKHLTSDDSHSSV